MYKRRLASSQPTYKLEPTKNMTPHGFATDWNRRFAALGVHSFLLMTACLLCSPSALGGDILIDNVEANRYGLERAWFAQVRVDRSRHQVADWVLDHGELFALSTDGTVNALNAETGEKNWVSNVMTQDGSTVGLGVNAERVAVLGATRMFVLNRKDGRLRTSWHLGGAPSSSPALSNKIAYVTLLSGRVEGYELETPNATVWQYQSKGRCFLSPSVTGTIVSWPSTGGILNVANAEDHRPLFRINTNDEIVSPPSSMGNDLLVASLDGYLYCFHEYTGFEHWRYSTGYGITSKPAIAGKMAFVASEEPALHAVDATNGEKIWKVDGIDQFVALSEHFAYGMDRFGTLTILNKETGSIVGRIPTDDSMNAIVNDKTDRIFLVNEQGLVQCLREIGATKPMRHEDVLSEDDAKKQPAKEEAEDDNPFAAEQPEPAFESEDSEPEGNNPFGAPAEDSFEEDSDDDDNPFF